MRQTVQLRSLSLGSFGSRIHVLCSMLSSQIRQMISNKDLVLHWSNCASRYSLL